MGNVLEDIPKGTFEISDLHPDTLAKYGMSGEPPAWEKFLINAGINILGDLFQDTANRIRGMAEERDQIPRGVLEIAWPDDPGRASVFVGPMPAPEVMAPLPPKIYELAETLNHDENFVGPQPIGKIGLTTGGVVEADDAFALTPGLLSEIGLYNDPATNFPSDHEKYNIIIRETTARVNTVLEERSFLDFEFPNPSIGTRRICMFENPELTETRSPSYAKQPIVQRNEPARLYVGAEPRKLSLRFNYTLPLVEEFLYKSFNKPVGWNDVVQSEGTGDSVKVRYASFIGRQVQNMLTGEDWGGDTDQTFKAGLSESGDQWELKNTGLRGPRPWEGLEPVSAMSTPVQAGGSFPMSLNSWSIDAQTMQGPLFEALTYTHYVIDTVRTSVIGDRHQLESNKIWGPPIVKFRHGTLYEQDPWIVTSYSINFDHTAGMDPRTLLPRRVKFVVELEEYHQTTGAHHGGGNVDLPGAQDILHLDSDHRDYLWSGKEVNV